MESFIETQEALERQISRWGFMPFFKSGIEGFSIEDVMPPGLLFGERGLAGEVGAWQWRGPMIGHCEAAYGKFFNGKVGYVALEWLPDLINFRRHLLPHDRLPHEALHILQVLRENESMLSRQLKKASGYTLARRKTTFNPQDPAHPIVREKNGASFDALISTLQMGAYVCVADFEYAISRQGRPYGWGVARYTTPEAMYDLPQAALVQGRTPAQSRERITDHLKTLFPHAPEQAIQKLI